MRSRKVDMDMEERGLNNVHKIIGNNEYGEKPYLISEMLGNSSLDTIVHAYSLVDALDNYVEYGEDELGWEVSDLPDLNESEIEEGNYYYAKGYYPVDLDYVAIKELEHEDVRELTALKSSEGKREKDTGFERE